MVRSNVLPVKRMGALVSFEIMGVVVLASRAVSVPSRWEDSGFLIVVASLTREGLFLFKSCKLNQAESRAAMNLGTASLPLYHLLNRESLPSTIIQK